MSLQLPTLDAWGSRVVELDPACAERIADTGLVAVELVSAPDRWRLTADSRVGIVIGDGWELRVVPRLTIPKLMFLLSYAADPSGWKRHVVSAAEEDELFSAVAAGFAHHALYAIEPGPIRGYRSVDDTSRVMRGRLRIADQIARRPGLPTPLEITYEDYTLDIPENQLLAAATQLLLRMPRVPNPARARLRRVQAVLEGTSPPSSLDVPATTRLNRRYAAATWFASLILRHAGVATRGGFGASVSFIFDMNRVFEDFLTTALTESLSTYGGLVRSQFDRYHLDEERKLRLRPDITWWSGGRPAAVIDAKYKRLEDARFPNADAYQMLAYCLRFGLSRGTLVYAKDAIGTDRAHSVPAGVELCVRSIDVEQLPADVLVQVDRLAAEIVTPARPLSAGR
jgi:5-methylcytosine-specific restriction enzyme subunit McrC